MATTIENRIVSLIFDNLQFEKNVATSQKTLKALDEQLQFKDADKNFKTLNKAASQVNFSTIVNSAEEIGVKLKASAIVGAEMIKRLTNSAINFAKSAASKVMAPLSGMLNQIETGGWNRATNIDKAKFKLSGLGVVWDDIVDDINHGVADTAYGLDEAAAAAANLTSAGVEFGKAFGETGSSPMAKALRGISGLASMFDRSYDDLANLYQVIAASGGVTNDVLSRFQERGIPVAAELARVFHTTEEAIHDMAKNGEISFNEFAKIMDDAFGEHAKDANSTFEGALANMNSALSRIGEKFASSYRANMVPVYNALRTTFNGVKGTMTEVFTQADASMSDLSDRFVKYVEVFDKYVIKSGALESIFNGIANYMEGAYNILAAMLDTLLSAFKKVVPDLKKSGEAFEKMSESFLNLTMNEDFIKKLIESMKTFINIIKTSVSIIKTIYGYAKQIVSTVLGVIDLPQKSFQDVLKSILDFLKKIDTFLKGDLVSGFIDRVASGLVFAVDLIKRVWSTIKTVYGNIKNIFASKAFEAFIGRVRFLVYYAIEFIKTLWNSIKDAGTSIYEVLKKAIPSDFIINILDKTKPVFGTLIWLFQRLRDLFSGGDKEVSVLSDSFSGFVRVLQTVSRIFKVVWAVIDVSIRNIFSVLGAAKDAFFEVFSGSGAGPDKLVGGIGNIIDSILKFVNSLLFSEKTIDNFKRIFKGVFSLIDLGKDIFIGAFQIISTVFSRVTGDMSKGSGSIIDTITGVLATLADWIVAIKEWIDEHDAINKVAIFIVRIFGVIVDAVETAIELVKTLATGLDNFVIAVTGSSIKEHFDNLLGSVTTVLDKIGEIFTSIVGNDDIDKATEKVKPFAAIWEGIKNAFSGFTDYLTRIWPTVEKIFGFIGNVVSGVLDILGRLVDQLSIPTLSSAALGVSALFGAWDGTFAMVETTIDKIGEVLTAFKDTLARFQEGLKADVILKIAKAVMLLAGAVFLLSIIEPQNLLVGLAALEAIVLTISGAMRYFSMLAEEFGKNKNIAATMGTMGILVNNFAKAILTISIAMMFLGTLKIEQLLAGLGAVLVLVAALTIAIRALAEKVQPKQLNGLGKVLKGMAVALLVLAFTVAKIAKIDTAGVIKAVVAIGALIAVMAGAIAIIANTGDGKNIKEATGGISAAFVALAQAINIIVPSIAALSDIDWGTIGKAGAVIGGLMVLLTMFAAAADDAIAAVAFAAAMVMIAYSLKLLVPSLVAMNDVSWESIGKAALIILGLMAGVAVMGPAVVVLAAFAAALLLIGASVYVFGSGMLKIAKAFAILAASAAGAGLVIDALVAGFGKAMPILVQGVITAVQKIIAAIIAAIPFLVTAIVTGLGDILFNIITTISKICDAVILLAPKLTATLIVIVNMLLTVLFVTIPRIVDTLITVIIAIIDGVAARAQELVISILNLVWQIVKAVFIGLWYYVVEFFKWFASNIWPTLKEFFASIWAAISGWFVGLWTDVSNWFDTTWQTIKDWGKELIGKLGEGISETIDSIVGFFEGMWKDVQDFFSNIWEGVKGLGRKFVGFFTGGVEEDPNTVYNTTYELGKQAEQGLIDATNTHSPSVDTTNIGSYFGEGMYNGMESWMTNVHDMGFGLGEEGVTGLGEGLGGLGDTLQNALGGLPEEDTQLSITPVIDMDNLQVKGDDNIQWYSDLNGTPVDSNTNLFSQFTADNAQAVAAQESNNQLTEQTLTELQGMREDNVTSSEATVASLDAMASKIEMLQTELIGKFNDLSRVQIQNTANTNAEITNIRSDLSVLATAVNNMKVVLDTGAIAGDITPKIDVRLGREAAYRGRGIK